MKSSPSGSHIKASKVKIKYGNVEKDLPRFTRTPGVAVDPTKKTKSILKSSKSNKSSKNEGTASGTVLRNKTSTITQAASTSSLQRRQQQQTIPRKGECEVCKQPCRSHCAGCKKVFYCSKQHQQADWPRHKLICRPFSIPTQYSSGFHLRPPAVNSSTSITSNNSSQGSLGNASNIAPELQYMMATKKINGGGIIFSERPLLVTANILTLHHLTSEAEKVTANRNLQFCCSCFAPINSGQVDINNNDNSKAPYCPKCVLPLCSGCLLSQDNPSKTWHPGLGHSAEECAFMKQFLKESPQFVSNLVRLGGNKEELYNFLKDMTLLRIFMFRNNCLWRWENLLALKNNPRFIACCKHNFGNIEEWLKGEYPVSNYYMKIACKEKPLLLTDVVKICGVFCEKSNQNPNWLIIYENRAWIPHACSPNSEMFHKFITPEQSTSTDANVNTLEIIVKAVEIIEEGTKITMNHIQSFEGGRSALAVRLFQSKGLFCCESECPCYQRGFDKSLGVRCDLFQESEDTQACTGILSPKVEPPNPDKSNLGMGIFVKSKKWECDKCTKSVKYTNLHPKILAISKDLSEHCERCCTSDKNGNNKVTSSYLQFQSKLFSSLSNQHWMVWKSKARILRTWSDTFGHCAEMIKLAVSLPPGSHTRDSMMYATRQKVNVYGCGIYDIPKDSARGKMTKKNGLLEYTGKRHGSLSPRRGEMLLDAFYANLVLLIEDYKKELPLSPGESSMKRNQVAKENQKKLEALKELLEKSVQSLKLCEGTTKMSLGNIGRFLKTASDSLDILKAVYNQVQKSPAIIIGHLNDFLELYACQDQKFVASSVKASQPRRDPFRIGVDDLEFETDSGNFGPASYNFGMITASSSTSTFRSSGGNSSNASTDRFKPNAKRFTTFNNSRNEKPSSSSFSSSSSFPFNIGSPRSNTDSEDDNPFVYSRGSTFKKPDKKKDSSNKSKAKNSGGSGAGAQEDEDWSNYFWFTSDEDDLNDEFDLGFDPTKPSPRFGEDLYNDDELDELAEWAALQFMIGKLNVT